jgi:hypothetical protein
MLSFSSLGGASTPLFISKGASYKEGNRVGFNMTLIKTLFLLAYFTFASIDIAIYALGNTLRPSGVFWKMGRVLAGPSLGHPS